MLSVEKPVALLGTKLDDLYLVNLNIRKLGISVGHAGLYPNLACTQVTECEHNVCDSSGRTVK